MEQLSITCVSSSWHLWAVGNFTRLGEFEQDSRLVVCGASGVGNVAEGLDVCDDLCSILFIVFIHHKMAAGTVRADPGQTEPRSRVDLVSSW